MSTPSPFVSYAQHGEDVILWRALGDRGPGTYVDVGAFHPTQDSVTRALYDRGWRGVNIEAQPEFIAAFEHERPQDTNLSLAIGDRDGTATLTLPVNPGWTSVLPTPSEVTRTIEVPMRRLDTLLPELGIERVDVLKIDVEGAEPDVVRGLLGGVVRPTVCVVAGVSPHVGRTAGDEAVALLVAGGYVHCLFDGLNHYLTTDPSLEAALSVPANPVDGFTTDLVHRLHEERRQLHAAVAALVSQAAPHATHAVVPDTEPEPRSTDVRAMAPAAHDEAPQQSSTREERLPVEPASSPLGLDADVRLQRRRASFAQLLQGAPLALPLASAVAPLARLLRLSAHEGTSAEAVAVLYREILGRDADADGLAAWIRRVEAGMPLLTAARLLADSAEALAQPVEQRARVQRDLTTWESYAAVVDLGIAAWRPEHGYTPGQVHDEVLVRALYEVALHRQPTAGETAFEVAKLRAGAGREWLVRSFAARPEARTHLLGAAPFGPRGRLRRWRDLRGYLTTFRVLVAQAESRQIARLLAVLDGRGLDLTDALRPPPRDAEDE